MKRRAERIAIDGQDGARRQHPKHLNDVSGSTRMDESE